MIQSLRLSLLLSSLFDRSRLPSHEHLFWLRSRLSYCPEDTQFLVVTPPKKNTAVIAPELKTIIMTIQTVPTFGR